MSWEEEEEKVLNLNMDGLEEEKKPNHTKMMNVD